MAVLNCEMPDELYSRAKEKAGESGNSLASFVRLAIEAAIRAQHMGDECAACGGGGAYCVVSGYRFCYPCADNRQLAIEAAKARQRRRLESIIDNEEGK